MKMHPLLKAIGVFAILMSLSLLSTGSEIFTTKFNEAANWDNPGGSWTSYNEKTYAEGAWFFHSTIAVRGGAAESFGGSAYSFRDRDVFSVHNTAAVSGMTGFSMQLRDWMLGSGEQRNLNVSYDGGVNWETLVTINKAWFDAYQVYQEYVYFFPGGPHTFDAEQFKLEIDGGNDSNNGRINIGEFVAYGTMTTVATPAFNPSGGEFLEALEVEITTATPGASIYYTLNGADPTQSDNPYTDPIPVDDDVTIKARAFADGMDPSATSQATYTFPEITEVATLAALRDMSADGTYYKYTGNAVIVAMDGFRNRKFIQDATAAILIDDNPGVITTEYDLYDVITDVTGKLNVFNNMLRFQPELNTPEATQNTPVEPVLFAMDEITPDDQAKLIKFEEVSFTSTGSFQNGQNYTISDGENEFIFRTDFWDVDYIGDPLPLLPVNISGVMIQYQDDLQIVARFQDDIELSDPPEDPGIITLSATSLPSFRNVYTGNFSDVQFYTVEASNLDGNLTITAGSPLKVSLDCTDDFVTSLVLTETGGNVAEHKIYVRAFPVSTGNFNPVINHSDGFVAKAIPTQVTGTASQIPSGYYSTATGFGEVLMTQLHNIINDHTVLTYESIWGHFETTDARFDGSVWDVFSYVECEDPPYSYVFFDDQQGAGTYPDVEGVVYNREHLWPQSWWAGSDPSPMVTDLHHVYPADRWVNAQKSNYPFGEISNPTWTSEAGNKIGNNSYGSAYSGMAFEPVDELKGDFARTYLYMATRYMDQLPDWSSQTVASNVLDGSEFPGFEPWFINMLLEWHENDPVSQKEIERNNAIYALQNNRNPFIDNPDFAYLVWGEVPDIPVGELCNLDFEDWFNDLPYCWYGVRSNIPKGSVSRYEDNPQSGSYAVRLINAATSHQRFTTHQVAVEAGVDYAITFWAKGKGDLRTGLFDDRGTGFGYAPYNDYLVVDSDDWSQHTQTITAANTTDIGEFIFSLRNTDEARNHLQIDNVSIEVLVIEDPLLFVDPVALAQLNYEEGAGPSASESFELGGVNLDGSAVNITAPAGFEVSTDNVSFSASVALPSYTGDAIDVFVRLQAALDVGSYSGNVVVAGGGADEKMVAVSGAVTAPVEPFDIPYANAFRSLADNQAAEAVGFVIENAQNETGAGGYLRIFPGGYLETPAIDFSAYENLLFVFDATTFGGALGQSLTLMISTDGGNSYSVLNTWELTGSYVNYEELIDLSKKRTANGKLKVEMTAGGGSSRFRDFSLEEQFIPDFDDPVLNPDAGTYFADQTVFVSNYDAFPGSVSLYYTTDGSNPNAGSELYNHSQGILLEDGQGAITLKVIAIETATGSQSNIVTAQYVFPLNVETIAALRSQKSPGTLYRLTGEAILTFQTMNRNQKYIQDATAAILIDDNAGNITTEYDLYDGITGLVGTLGAFANMVQFVPAMDPGQASSVGNTVIPGEVVLDDLNPDHQAQLVSVNSVQINPGGDTEFIFETSYELTDASGNGILRTAYPDLDYIGGPIPAAPQNITAVMLQFGTQLQLVPRSWADFEADSPGAHVVEFFVEGNNGLLMASVDGVDIVSGDLVETGSNVLFTATPDEGYQVKAWTINGDVIENRTQESLFVEDLSNNITVTVEFELMPLPSYVVEFGVIGGNGTLAASVSGEPINSGDLVEEGKNVLFTATPDEGYQIKEWRRNGFLLIGYTQTTFTNINLNQNITVTVKFEPKEEPVPDDLHIAIEEDVIIAHEDCFFANATIAVAGGSFAFTIQDGAAVTMAAGQKIRLLPGSSVESGGYLHAFISENDPCRRPFAFVEDVSRKDVVTDIEIVADVDKRLSFSIYPNPTNHRFTVDLNHYSYNAIIVNIRVLGMRGELIKQRDVQAGQKHVFSLEGRQPGIYIIQVTRENEVAVERLILQ